MDLNRPEGLTHWQFSLRGMMIVMLVVAVLCAVTAPYLRTLTAMQWKLLGMVVGIFLAVWIGSMTIIVAMRRRAEKLAGKLILLFRPHTRSPVWRTVRDCWAVIFTAAAAVAIYEKLESAQQKVTIPGAFPSLDGSDYFVMSMFAAGLASMWMWPLVWSWPIELRANGIVEGVGLYRWELVNRLDWLESTGELRIRIKHYGLLPAWRVPLEDRPAVTEALKQVGTLAKCIGLQIGGRRMGSRGAAEARRGRVWNER